MKQSVKFKCPQCGKAWVEEQNVDDDWYGLATDVTLCEDCSQYYLRQLKKALKETQHDGTRID